MSEDDFQRMLDANPEDHYTRLVFADWLQDRDDPRAEGYRVLGLFRRVPKSINWIKGGKLFLFARGTLNPLDEYFWVNLPHLLPLAWMRAETMHAAGLSRRELEDALAMAFQSVAKTRRAKLLRGVAA